VSIYVHGRSHDLRIEGPKSQAILGEKSIILSNFKIEKSLLINNINIYWGLYFIFANIFLKIMTIIYFIMLRISKSTLVYIKIPSWIASHSVATCYSL
jgi:hypothetical protein